MSLSGFAKDGVVGSVHVGPSARTRDKRFGAEGSHLERAWVLRIAGANSVVGASRARTVGHCRGRGEQPIASEAVVSNHAENLIVCLDDRGRSLTSSELHWR